MFKQQPIVAALALAFGAGGMVLMAAPAIAQQEPQKLEKVEITGSSIKRIEGETALPVQVITREEIQRTGASTVEQLMLTVSAAASSQNIVAASASGATTLGLSGISLRGLSSLRTLVLVNGKRVTPYGYGFTNDSVSVDVNSIPISAIERVEILKDGASAIYGSDAIAGVVNFILRKDFKGAEISAEYGQPKKSAGSTTRVYGTYGVGDLAADRYNVMATLSYQKEKPLFGRDRKFASSGISLETGNDTTSGNTFPANVVDAGTGGNVVFGNPAWPGCPGPYSVHDPIYDLAFGAGNYPACRFDPASLVTLVPETERTSLFVSGHLQITPAVEAYAEVSYSKNKQTTVIQPTPISDQFALAPNNPLFNVPPYSTYGGSSAIVVTSASPFYPTAFVVSQTGGATPDLLVRWRAAALGNRSLTDTSEAPRLNLGVKGAVGSIDYDGGVLYSGSKVREHTNDGYVIQSMVLPILNSDQVNFWGPNSQAIQNQLDATEFHGDALKTETSLSSVYAKGSSELAQLPGGPLAVAIGGELRKEKYKLDPSTEILGGDLTGYGGNFLPVDVSRNVKAVFTELNVPIVRSLEANVAVRYDNYGEVGSKTTPKFSLRWQPMRELLLRTAYGKGFRAPSLLDLNAPQTTGVTPQGLSDPLRCHQPGSNSNNDCLTQFPNLNGGNPDLKPEQSKNFTAGIVLEPSNNVSMAFDFFKITLTDTIVNGINADVILADPAKYASLIVRGPVDPAFPNLPGPIIQITETNLNLGESRLQGLDIDWRFGLPTTSIGKFTINLNGTYFAKYDTQNLDGSFSGSVDQANNSTGGVVPRWKHYLSLNWETGPWSTTLAQNYQSSYTDAPDAAFGNIRMVGSYETYDMQTSFTGVKGLTITGGIRNLFDRDPPFSNVGGQAVFQSGYDPSYVDPRGRFFYGRLTYKFN